MKNCKLILILIFFGLSCKAQNFNLKIIGNTPVETKIIDSIGYNSTLQNIKLVDNEVNITSEKLKQNGYIETKIAEIIQQKDSSFLAKIILGNKIKNIHIYIGVKNPITKLDLLEINTDTLVISYSKIESFLNETLQKLEQKGYAFAKLKLVNIQNKKQTLYADLEFTSGYKRQLNEIVIKYSNERQKNLFPKGALKQINRKYVTETFNQETVKSINRDFEKFSFINQVKFPEVLFTKDTTKVYVYLEKRNSNTFDGYLGFNNTDSKKITLNGYLDLNLENILKTGERIAIYWKNDGNQQRIFNASLDLPYLFNSAIGIKALVNIFKQDSTYQNTKTEINLGYLISINKRLYLGHQSTESNNIQNSINPDLSDYKSSFLTATIEYTKNNSGSEMYPLETSLFLNMGTGKRTTNQTTVANTPIKQYFLKFNIMKNLFINEKNSINLKSQNYYLQSKTYLINELYRFGGISSIRGFSENSLQANFMASIITEYRYLIAPNMYLNSILDYCYYKDSTRTTDTNKIENLLGIGIGLGMQTKSGFLKIAIANGTAKKQEIKFYNTILSICYNVKF